MAPIYILIGFGFGYLFGKLLEPRNLCPRNWGYKLLLCIGIPSLLYGLVFLIVGVSCNWWMYMVGAKTAAFFMGCVGLLISMLIFVKVKKPESVSDNEPTQTQDESIVSESVTAVVPEEPETVIVPEEEIKQEEERDATKEKEDELSPFEEFMAWLKNTDKKYYNADDKQNAEQEDENRSKTRAPKSRYTKIVTICTIVVILLLGVIAVTAMVMHKNKLHKEIEELCSKGNDAYKKELFDLAISEYDKALKLDSTNWSVYYLIGRCYSQKDYYSIASSYYQKAYKSNPTQSNAILCDDTIHYESLLYNYAWSLQRTSGNEYGQKLTISQEYFSLYSDLSKAYRIMTFACFEEGDKDKALQWAKKMVKNFPKDADSYFCLAFVLADLYQTRQAIENYETCIKLEPNNSAAYNNLGNCYEKCHQYTDAYRCWRKAVELSNEEYSIQSLKRHGQYNY